MLRWLPALSCQVLGFAIASVLRQVIAIPDGQDAAKRTWVSGMPVGISKMNSEWLRSTGSRYRRVKAIIDGIADLDPLRLERGGQDAVKDRRFELALAPQHRELLAVRQQVDRLVAAQDAQLVDGQRARIRLPRNGDRTHHRQSLRRQDLHRGFDIALVRIQTEAHLLVEMQERDRRVALLHRVTRKRRRHLGRDERHHPAGRRRHHGLVFRPGRRAQRKPIKPQTGARSAGPIKAMHLRMNFPARRRIAGSGGPARACRSVRPIFGRR